MREFRYRFQTLLEIRSKEEQEAKRTLFHAMAARLEAEKNADLIRSRKVSGKPSNLGELVASDALRAKWIDELAEAEAVVGILANEEEVARQSWIAAKREADSLTKLKDRELSDYRIEEKREEQKEMDDWTVSNRRAA